MKQLHIISVFPSDLRFYWETAVQLNNAREHGFSHKFRVLIFTPKDRENIPLPKEFKKLEELFPEVKFFYYTDKSGIVGDDIRSSLYIPILRPYCLKQHFKEYPELSQDAILYIDSDILFTSSLDFLEPFLQDDINYLSDTKTYLNSEYFDSKQKDTLPEKLESFKQIDVLQNIAHFFGISRQAVEDNKNNTGGAQYLLKNIDSNFWQDVYTGCLYVKWYLSAVNREYFPSEEKGFQSWCADMVSVLYNLWKRQRETITPKELDFAWSTDHIERLGECSILHNAGITDAEKLKVPYKDEYIQIPVFFKNKYNLKTPFQDIPALEKILENEEVHKYCNSFYITEIIKTKQNLNL